MAIVLGKYFYLKSSFNDRINNVFSGHNQVMGGHATNTAFYLYAAEQGDNIYLTTISGHLETESDDRSVLLPALRYWKNDYSDYYEVESDKLLYMEKTKNDYFHVLMTYDGLTYPKMTIGANKLICLNSKNTLYATILYLPILRDFLILSLLGTIMIFLQGKFYHRKSISRNG